MAVIVRTIVSPTSERISEIAKNEQELISTMGKENFRKLSLNGSISICNRIVSDLSKDATEEQMAQINALFPEGKGFDSISQVCLKMRELINLDILPNSEEAKDLPDQLEEEILEMIEAPVEESRTITCKMAVERGDLETLKRLKKLGRGWNQDLLKLAQDRLDRIKQRNTEKDSEKMKKMWLEEIDNAKAVCDWIEEELKRDDTNNP
ncbi:MAG: hypothetical protein ACK4HV_03865 [Parachlamydiaceae bacterium]